MFSDYFDFGRALNFPLGLEDKHFCELIGGLLLIGLGAMDPVLGFRYLQKQ